MLDTQDLEDAAKKAAGNWQRFKSFIWFRDQKLVDAKRWAVIYTHNRDSGLLDQSNAFVIKKTLEPFTDGDDPDVVMESHSHWAVGHVDGFSIRVFNPDGTITSAFTAYYELAEQMDEYPILDEADYSNREHEATLENITDAGRQLKDEFDLPEDWECETYSWLSDHRSGEVENKSDQGGYPSEKALRAAFKALGYKEQE
jgi:hypothetical protein